MHESNDNPSTDDAAPDYAILALLDFEPAPRKYKRAGSWTPALQRQFIVQLALTGSPARAAEAMKKCRYGAEKLYKADGAEGFRGAWDAALALFEKRDAVKRAGEQARWLGVRPPGGVDKRMDQSVPTDRGAMPMRDAIDEEADGMSDAGKAELVASIGAKFLRKVEAEREARLSGRIVAADFYLRQVTCLEVIIELTAGGMAGATQLLGQLRRGEHGVLDIADTPFVRMLDGRRRAFWEANGEPMRPEQFREEFMRDFGAYRLEADQHTLGPASEPARGHTPEQWAALTANEQKAARERQFEEDAAVQVAWEREAYAEFQARQAGEAQA